MNGVRLSEKNYALIKSLLITGYSVKKVIQMLPDEISVSEPTVRKVDASATYDDYCGIKKEEPPKAPPYLPHSQTKDIVDAIGNITNRLDDLCSKFDELLGMLK